MGVVHLYAAILSLAIVYDLATDRSFGGVMLSTIPIAAIAALCLLIGPWLNEHSGKVALAAWCIGAMLVLLSTIFFASLGQGQASTGELVFTYACLLLAFPLSSLLPIVMAAASPSLDNALFLRIGVAWSFTVLAAGATWWLMRGVRRGFEWLRARHR